MKKKMGRPKKNIDKKTFEELCGIWCTEEEICSVFDITDKTLCNWCKNTYGATFSEVYKRLKNGIANVSLRRIQLRLAEKSASMAIFLGKQYLGQRDFGVANDSEKQIEDLNAVLNDAGLNGSDSE